MELKEDSWHVRFYKEFIASTYDEELPRNFCVYAGKILGWGISLLIFAFIGSIIIASGIAGLFTVPYVLYTWQSPEVLPGFLEHSVVAGGLLYIVLIALLLAATSRRFCGELFRAIKDKYCPIIEWRKE